VPEQNFGNLPSFIKEGFILFLAIEPLNPER